MIRNVGLMKDRWTDDYHLFSVAVGEYPADDSDPGPGEEPQAGLRGGGPGPPATRPQALAHPRLPAPARPAQDSFRGIHTTQRGKLEQSRKILIFTHKNLFTIN